MCLRLWGWGRLLYSFTSNRQNQTDIRPCCWAWPRAGGQEKGENRHAPFFGGEAGLFVSGPGKGEERFYLVSWPTTFSRVLFSCLSCSFSSSMSSRSCEKGRTDRSGVSTFWTDLDTWIFTTPPLYLWGPSQVGVLVWELKWALLAARFPPSSQAALIATN